MHSRYSARGGYYDFSQMSLWLQPSPIASSQWYSLLRQPCPLPQPGDPSMPFYQPRGHHSLSPQKLLFPAFSPLLMILSSLECPHPGFIKTHLLQEAFLAPPSLRDLRLPEPSQPHLAALLSAYKQGCETFWVLGVGVQGEAMVAVKHPTMHRTAHPQQRIIQPKMSIAPRLRNTALETYKFVKAGFLKI